MELPELINRVLLFASVSACGFIVIRLVSRVLMERLEFKPDRRYEELKRFIDPVSLQMRRFFAALVVGCVMFILQLAFGVEKMAIAIPVSMGFGIGAYFLVYIFYRRMLALRKEAFEIKILDLAMGITNSMRSGLALGQAIESVAKRIGGPMQEELNTLLQEYRLGVELPEVFERLYKRMPCEDMHLLATTISLTTRSGGSMVEVLEEMVKTIRARTEFQERLKNMTSAGRFEALSISLAPFAAFVLLYFIDPVLMTPLVTTGIGWIAVGVVCFLVACGYYVLRRMITIEV